LPRELIECEARLTQFVAAPSRIDRDQLMYRAGWAAARARKGHMASLLPVLCSAAAAAVLSVAITWRLATVSSIAIADQAGDEIAAGETAVARRAERVNPPVPAIQRAASRFQFTGAPLLAMRDRALRFEFDELAIDASDAPAASTPAVSARQLRDEFLPQRKSDVNGDGLLPWERLLQWTREEKTS
jgi:hypothetical protein